MRKICLLVSMMFFAFVASFAQVKEGKIIFERKTNMRRMITDPEMRARIPEFRTEKFELIFNEQSSVFKTIPDDEAPDPFANNGGGGDRGGMRMMFRMPETTIFTDLNTQIQLEARSLFEKDYLIVDTLKPLKWKLSEETKTIAKYVCKKATTSIVPQQLTMRFGGGNRGGDGNRGGGNRGGGSFNVGGVNINRGGDNDTAAAKPKEIEIVVWYTESIPVSVGPDTYAGLPGAILEVDSDNGNNVITAQEYTAKYSAKELKQPTKGEKMNRAKFMENMQELMKGFQRGGGIQIRSVGNIN
ncbi:MAG: GLPGLI family protein [Chitinophagia bacterium]|jgi:GLPGLI family protein|nr:GLPGLI family protein [Chitinophagia bacterium]